MLNYNLIKKLKVTEKTSADIYNKENVDYCRKYTFVVDIQGTKEEISNFVEKFYNVKVKQVNTRILKGRVRMFKRIKGQTSDQKIATITLEKGYKLDIEVDNVA